MVPYLDILMNLILFMLLSMAGLVTLGALNATTPGPGGSGDPAAAPPVLTCTIRATGFTVATTAPAVAGPTTIPLKHAGRHDYAALTEHLRRLSPDLPSETRFVLAVSPDTPFETVIATMDAARETPTHTRLFPDVTLASEAGH